MYNTLASCSFDQLRSPEFMDKKIAGCPKFGVFWNKETWLDVVKQSIENADHFGLSPEHMAAQLTAGGMRPGPRILFRWICGEPTSKLEFSAREQTEFCEVINEFIHYFQ